jgi:tetratricopeptide (TPR) repeat protein
MRESKKSRSMTISTVFALCILYSGCSSEPEPSSRAILSETQEALRNSEYELVQQIAQAVSPDEKVWQKLQLLVGEAAQKSGNHDRAIKIYLQVADHDKTTVEGQAALFYAAEVFLNRGQLSQAEPFYHEILQYQPKNGLTHQRIGLLLSLSGRHWEALDSYYELVKSGNADYLELGITADLGRHIEQEEFLRQCRKQSPNDPLVRLALATQAYNNGTPEARSLLSEMTKEYPHYASAHTMLGELLMAERDDGLLQDWHKSLPADIDDSSDIWFVRGLWARQHDELRVAADCFEQAVIRVPFHRRAYYFLGQALLTLEDPRANEVIAYSKSLIDLSQTIDQVLQSKGQDEKAIKEITRLLEQLGRIWEVCAWGVMARQNFPQSAWPDELLSHHAQKLSPDLPRIEPDKLPIKGQILKDIPALSRLIHKWSTESNPSPNLFDYQLGSRIQFEIIDAIDFQYNNADDPETKGARTFEQSGGGVAIIDYDLDHQPDVFLSQGSLWKTGEDAPSYSLGLTDGLFRNKHSGSRFEDVSFALTGLDSGFGQGCSVGDFDNDGFPDLYVANVGRNCLYQNMGDGSFTQVTDLAGIFDESWTTSVMICDLNADGFPDLFDVNYLQGEGLYSRICQGHACSPKNFPGAPDSLWINAGDGTFQSIPNATPQSDSKGLGVVAFVMEDAKRPSLFIANDQVANFLLENKPSNSKNNIQFDNRALIAGLAFNENGLSMACMGIAIDDWDNNNKLDIFVTNFHDESNTLYLQDYPGLFVDTTKTSGLYTSSIQMTGWGTQSLDANLDGFPDLVVTNGHVDDYTDKGIPYQMPPQFFQNTGSGFQELSSKQAGPWFAKKYLGRGLAKIDWNQDGRFEFIVSNMNAQVSVMKNVSQNAGHHLTFELHAVQTARDAIGTRVTVRADRQNIERQLTAGDGYMASNERMIQFGLGTVNQVTEVIVSWPSGSTTMIADPKIDSRYIVVEGSATATVLRGEKWESRAVTPR